MGRLTSTLGRPGTTDATERLSNGMNKFQAIVVAPFLCGALCGCAVTQECTVESCADDSQITAKIQSMFDQRSEFRPPNFVYVKTKNHVVYLSGQVNTDLVRERARNRLCARLRTGRGS
jgi:hypothetical protein